MNTTADGIAYRLARELEDLLGLASNAMHEANNDGAEYDVDDELASAKLALLAYRQFCAETNGGSHEHS